MSPDGADPAGRPLGHAEEGYAMLRRIASLRLAFAALPIALAAVSLMASAVLAGGYAIANLDSTPQPRAGEATTLGFTVLQHGVTPVTSGDVSVMARNSATGETIAAKVVAEGKPGHYVATLTFPSAGTWSWEITLERLQMQSKFPPLTVLPASAAPAPAAPAATEPAPGGIPAQAIAGGAVLAALLLGAGYLFLRRRPAVIRGSATELS
jgi:YtkA-like protein